MYCSWDTFLDYLFCNVPLLSVLFPFMTSFSATRCASSTAPSRVSCTFVFYPLNLYAGHSGSVWQRLTRILNCCEHKFTELSATLCQDCAQECPVEKYSQPVPDFRVTTSASSQEQSSQISTTRILLLRLNSSCWFI